MLLFSLAGKARIRRRCDGVRRGFGSDVSNVDIIHYAAVTTIQSRRTVILGHIGQEGEKSRRLRRRRRPHQAGKRGKGVEETPEYTGG